MQEGCSNIQYEEVVTAQEVIAEDEYHISNVSQEFEEAIYEVEIEDELIYEESLPVYEAVTAYEEIIDDTNTNQQISLEKNENYSNQRLKIIKDGNLLDTSKTQTGHNKIQEFDNIKTAGYKCLRAKHLKFPIISTKNPKQRTFEKNKKVKKLKNICEGALSINLGGNPDGKNIHKCFLCEKTFTGYDRHVSKANVIKHITKYHLTGKIAVKSYINPNQKKYYGFVGSLRILARNGLIVSLDKKNHTCFICKKILHGIKSYVMKHIDIHIEEFSLERMGRGSWNLDKDDVKQKQKKQLVSFGYDSDDE